MKKNKKILRILKLNKNDNFNNDTYIKFSKLSISNVEGIENKLYLGKVNLYKVLNYKRFNYLDK